VGKRPWHDQGVVQRGRGLLAHDHGWRWVLHMLPGPGHGDAIGGGVCGEVAPKHPGRHRFRSTGHSRQGGDATGAGGTNTAAANAASPCATSAAVWS
jgi:hypothetical protein